MNWKPSPETRCKYVHVSSGAAPTTMDGGSAGFASLHGKDCSYNPIAFPPSMEVRCNLLGNAGDSPVLFGYSEILSE